MAIFAALTGVKAPTLSMSQTRELSKLQDVLKPSDSVKCSANIRIYRLERCRFREQLDISRLDGFLYVNGWQTTRNNHYAVNTVKAWCSEHGTIYVGFSRDDWDVTFDNAPGNDRCRER